MKKCYRVLFNFFSVLFLLTLVIFYGYRLIHFYMLEHKSYENKVVPFYEKLIDTKAIDGTNKGLQTKDDGYMYASLSDDNYVYYLGKMWRIISIDKNNNIKLITDEGQTILNWNQKDNFDISNINEWLNKTDAAYSGVFEKSLKNEEVMKQDGKVATLLSKNEYELLDEKNYLNMDLPYWIIGDDGKANYVEDGKVEITESDKALAIRPVIVIPSSVNYISGDGTKDNPYVFESFNPEKINDLFVGHYVTFGGKVWRIMDIQNDSVGLVLDDPIDYTGVYSNYDNEFSTKEGIGFYLNNDFLDSISSNNNIVDHMFYINGYNIHNEYNYGNKYDNSVVAKVGLLTIGDFYLNEKTGVYTMTPYGNTSKTIYVINDINSLYADYVTSTYKVRPVIYVNPELFVISGHGTKSEPYEVGR